MAAKPGLTGLGLPCSPTAKPFGLLDFQVIADSRTVGKKGLTKLDPSCNFVKLILAERRSLRLKLCMRERIHPQEFLL